tara:strand:+ start:121 stop:840 length:720 start_codon:yes stop_codon:yes gene_type:complete
MQIVLVEPSSCGNIGSVARVMKNTGLSKLALVNVVDWDTSETRALAHGAGEILDNATVHESLACAVADCTWIIGTTNRSGKTRNQIHEPAELIGKLKNKEATQSIAAVFGREKDGLSQEELQLCNFLVKFPSAVTYPSYNLSHAVLLLAYQHLLLKPHMPSYNHQIKSELANHSDREHLFDIIIKSLETVDFKHYNGDRKHFLRPLRRFFNKFDLTNQDIRVLLKICNQIIHFSKRLKR